MHNLVTTIFYFFLIVFHTHQDLKRINDGHLQSGQKLDERQLSNTRKGYAYTLILLQFLIFLLAVYVLYREPIAWDIIFLLTCIVVIVSIFSNVWLIMKNAAYYSADKGKAIVEVILSVIWFILSIILLNQVNNKYIYGIFIAFGCMILIPALATFYRMHLNNRDENDND